MVRGIFVMIFKPMLKALPSPSIDTLSRYVLGNAKKLTPSAFSKQFGEVKRSYMVRGKVDEFYSEASSFAKDLSKQQNNDFAGIVISSLSKVDNVSPSAAEKLALQGYEIAKANGDYVHMMARLNDLRKVYTKRPEKLYDYVQVLYKQEKCLRQLSKNYDKTVLSYKTISREAASQEDYTQMLAYVQTEIAKITKNKHPNDAMRKLLSARQIFENLGNQRSLGYIDMLINEIKKSPKYSGK